MILIAYLMIFAAVTYQAYSLIELCPIMSVVTVGTVALCVIGAAIEYFENEGGK